MKEVFNFIFGTVIGISLSLLLFGPKNLKLFSESVKSQRLNLHSQPDLSLYNDSLAQKLFNDVKLLCWVMTSPETHHTKAIHVKRTWGRRCNKLLFMSSKVDLNLGTVALPVLEGRRYLWDKTKRAFEHVYKNHFKDYDWFLKADDDK